MIKGGCLLFVTLTPFVYLALRTRGTLIPFIVIAAVSLLNVVLSGSPIAGFYPWTSSYLLLTGRLAQAAGTDLPGKLIIFSMGIFGICASFFRFQKEDLV